MLKMFSKLLCNEYHRITENIIMMGSANIPFKSVLKLSQLPLNYNPIEGECKKRISPGCKDCDAIELIGQDLALQFFENSNDYTVNFNPLSGTQANQMIYNAILNSADNVISFNPFHGGHSSNVDYLEKYFNVHYYGTNAQGKIDYDCLQYLIDKTHPKLVIAGASNYPRFFDFKKISELCAKDNTLLFADIAHTGIYNSLYVDTSPFMFADFISLTTHKTTRGPRGAILYYKTKFETLMKNSIYKISQCAPRYTDLLAKIAMFNEWKNINKHEYVTKIQSLSTCFSQYMLEHNEKLYTNGTDIHIVIIDVSSKIKSAQEIQSDLETINILVDICQIPNDTCNTFNGLRFGFLMLSTLGYSEEDMYKICEIIHLAINSNYNANFLKSKVKDIAIKKKYKIPKFKNVL